MIFGRFKAGIHPLSNRTVMSAAIFLLALSCGSQQKAYKRHFFSLDTSIDITLYCSHNPASIFDSIHTIIFGFDSLLSISNTNSDVWKINNGSGSWVRVHPAIASIIKYCEEECDTSGGWFDISVAPLKYLYGLESHQRDHHVATAAQLDSVRRYIDCGRIQARGDTAIMLDSGTTIDLGGIAKGFLLQRLKRFLLRAGHMDFLINLGGDLIAWGKKPGNKPWVVGIQHPRKPDALLATLPVSGACVFTSGDYERFFIEKGVRYHHLFDPHTCAPARKNQSATVIGADPVAIDALVKEAFFMEAPRALEYLHTKNMQGIVVDSSGAVWASASLKNNVQPSDSSVIMQFK